jgi:hypothetical protein
MNRQHEIIKLCCQRLLTTSKQSSSFTTCQPILHVYHKRRYRDSLQDLYPQTIPAASLLPTSPLHTQSACALFFHRGILCLFSIASSTTLNGVGVPVPHFILQHLVACDVQLWFFPLWFFLAEEVICETTRFPMCAFTVSVSASGDLVAGLAHWVREFTVHGDGSIFAHYTRMGN